MRPPPEAPVAARLRLGWFSAHGHDPGRRRFVRAETDRTFAGCQRDADGVTRFGHNREPTRTDRQTVIRMNRDTLNSFALVDVALGARLTVPDGGRRYVSVMVVDNDHHVTARRGSVSSAAGDTR